MYCFFGPLRILCLSEASEKAKIAFEQEHACSGLNPKPGCTKDDETFFGVSTWIISTPLLRNLDKNTASSNNLAVS